MNSEVSPSSIQANPLNSRTLLSTKTLNKPRGRYAKRKSFYARQRAIHGIVQHYCSVGVSGAENLSSMVNFARSMGDDEDMKQINRITGKA